MRALTRGDLWWHAILINPTIVEPCGDCLGQHVFHKDDDWLLGEIIDYCEALIVAYYRIHFYNVNMYVAETCNRYSKVVGDSPVVPVYF